MYAARHQTSCVAAILEAYCIIIARDTHLLMADRQEREQGVCKVRTGAGCCLRAAGVCKCEQARMHAAWKGIPVMRTGFPALAAATASKSSAKCSCRQHDQSRFDKVKRCMPCTTAQTDCAVVLPCCHLTARQHEAEHAIAPHIDMLKLKLTDSWRKEPLSTTMPSSQHVSI